MCGVLGRLGPGGELDGAFRALAHRGPDDHGAWRSPLGDVALLHRRLSIIDLTDCGRQPLANEDGTVLLCFNGEIYNFAPLRAELEKRGHRFRSRTDSEVLVHGWEEWGEALLERAVGMFAFALWDERSRRLVLARDAMGMKPLYYWWSPEGSLVFASEVKAFLGLPSFLADADPRSIREFMETGFVFDLHRTSLRGLRKLPAGHLLRVSLDEVSRGARPEPVRWFAPPGIRSWDGSEREADARADVLHDVLSAVVREHLVADVPLAILLSGGLDSSVVAALARRHGRIRTISMAFADSTVDERPHARRVADFLDTDHEEVVITPEEMASTVRDSAWWVDDLFGDWGLLSTMILYRRCREAGAKVVLVGEGSDELLGGYPDFESAGGPEADALGANARALRLYRWYSGRRWGRTLPDFLTAFRELDAECGGDAFAAVRLFETRRQLPVHYNMKVDKASMAASVEARVPFLDRRVAELGYETPRSLLQRAGTNKWLLRRMAERHRLLPQETIWREKFGASIAASWMDDSPSFRSFAREVVLDGRFTGDLGLRGAMSAYFEDGRRSFRFPHPLSILPIVAWRLLMLNLWGERYVGESRVEAA